MLCNMTPILQSTVTWVSGVVGVAVAPPVGVDTRWGQGLVMTRSMAGNRARETPWRSILPVTTSHVQVTDDNLIYILCLFTVILLYLRVVKFCDSQINFMGKSMCRDRIMIRGCSLEDTLLYIYYFITNKFYIQLFKKITFDVFRLKP